MEDPGHGLMEDPANEGSVEMGYEDALNIR